MIKLSKGMIPCVFKSYLLDNSGFNKVFGVFGNSVAPTRAEIQSLLNLNETNGEEFTITPKQIAEINPTAELRTEITYGPAFVAEQLSTNFFRFETSLASEEFVNRSVGDASWFMFAITSANNVNGSEDIPLAFIGSVGDSESDADIRIIDELIGNSTNYLLNDLEISYRV